MAFWSLKIKGYDIFTVFPLSQHKYGVTVRKNIWFHFSFSPLPFPSDKTVKLASFPSQHQFVHASFIPGPRLSLCYRYEVKELSTSLESTRAKAPIFWPLESNTGDFPGIPEPKPKCNTHCLQSWHGSASLWGLLKHTMLLFEPCGPKLPSTLWFVTRVKATFDVSVSNTTSFSIRKTNYYT